MKVIVFGAGGKTGTHVVEKALAAGHQVTIFVHTAPPQSDLRVRLITGDASNPGHVRAAISGHDAVIDTIGGRTPYKATELEQTAARNIVQAMKLEGVRRLEVVSMMGIGDSIDQTPFWYEYLLLPTFLHGATKDKTAMEATIESSNLDFLIARPPILTDDPATGTIQIITGDHKGHKITRADLAQFLVDQLTSPQYLGQAVLVANT